MLGVVVGNVKQPEARLAGVVGQSHVRAQLRDLLTNALLWAVLVVVAMASMGAFVARGLFRRTVANISDTATAIAAAAVELALEGLWLTRRIDKNEDAAGSTYTASPRAISAIPEP